MNLDQYPILAICGWSNSGKTTLIKQLVDWFNQHSLSVIVIKHTSHRFYAGEEGKDTDRLFRAGADVLMHGPDQSIMYCHETSCTALEAQIPILAARYDFLLCEGHKHTAIPKVWLTMPDQEPAPATLGNCLAVLHADEDRLKHVTERIRQRLSDKLLGKATSMARRRIMKATVDANTCIGCALCENTCPEVFKMNDSDIAEVIADPVPAEAEATCQLAADDCPVDAIVLED